MALRPVRPTTVLWWFLLGSLATAVGAATDLVNSEQQDALSTTQPDLVATDTLKKREAKLEAEVVALKEKLKAQGQELKKSSAAAKAAQKKSDRCAESVSDACANGKCNFRTLNEKIGRCLPRCASLFAAKSTTPGISALPLNSTLEAWLRKDAELAQRMKTNRVELTKQTNKTQNSTSRLVESIEALSAPFGTMRWTIKQKSESQRLLRQEVAQVREVTDTLTSIGNATSDLGKSIHTLNKTANKLHRLGQDLEHVESMTYKARVALGRATFQIAGAQQRLHKSTKDQHNIIADSVSLEVTQERLLNVEFEHAGTRWNCTALDLPPRRGYVCHQKGLDSAAVICKGLMLPSQGCSEPENKCMIDRPLVKQVACVESNCDVNKLSICRGSEEACRSESARQDLESLTLHF